VYLWNPVTGEGKKLDPKCSECLFMTFLPKDKLLLTCGTGWHMNLFDAETGTARFQIMIKGVVHCGAASPDAKVFAANMENGAQIGLWNIGGALQGTLPGHWS